MCVYIAVRRWTMAKKSHRARTLVAKQYYTYTDPCRRDFERAPLLASCTVRSREYNFSSTMSALARDLPGCKGQKKKKRKKMEQREQFEFAFKNVLAKLNMVIWISYAYIYVYIIFVLFAPRFHGPFTMRMH